MVKTYKFKPDSEEVIRLLPYLDKESNFRKSFYILYWIKIKNITFYIKDETLNDALVNLSFGSSEQTIGTKMANHISRVRKIYFYALIKDKVELVSFRFKDFESVYCEISKLIHEDKDPFDPMNGIGIRVKFSSSLAINFHISPKLELCEIDPISYATSLKGLKEFLLNRKVELSDIEKYELNVHENSEKIHDFLNSYEPLKKVKWKIRQTRLNKIMNK